MYSTPEISMIVCVFNEEESINPFLDELIPVLTSCAKSFEIIFVNDGSSDSTLNKIINYNTNVKIRIVNLSRNFGKELALTAGLDISQGQAVIPIDVDLQLPISIIPEFIKLWKKGFMNVIAIRKNRAYEKPIKRLVSNFFYKIITNTSKVNIIPNAGDFRLIDRKVVNEICKLREANRFMKGVFAYPGFSYTTIEFEVQPRAFGKTKWSFLKLWNFSLDGIFGFTTIPLRIWTYLGLFICLVSFLFSTYLIAKTILFGIDVPGYTTTILLILFFGGIQLISIGIIGEYIGRIFEESKKRPLYIIDELIDK